MLKISSHELKFEAKSRGYRPEILEKVYRLLDLLEQFMSVPYLAEHLALKDIRDKLIPVLKISEVPNNSFKAVEIWANNLFDGCKTGLESILPFQEHEIEFLNRLQQYGEIKPDLISNDSYLCERVLQYPLLHWRVKQIKK